MANPKRGKGPRISVVYRFAAGIVAMGFLLMVLPFGLVWFTERDASIGWLVAASGLLFGAEVFGYAAIAGRSPLSTDRMESE